MKVTIEDRTMMAIFIDGTNVGTMYIDTSGLPDIVLSGQLDEAQKQAIFTELRRLHDANDPLVYITGQDSYEELKTEDLERAIEEVDRI